MSLVATNPVPNPQVAEIYFHGAPLQGTPDLIDGQKKIIVHQPVSIAISVAKIIDIARAKRATLLCTAKPQPTGQWQTMLEMKWTPLGPAN